jgi:hypothetical protein
VQHRVISAACRLALEHVDELLNGQAFVLLARNRTDPSSEGAFEAWAYGGPLDLEVARPVSFGIGKHSLDALRALDSLLSRSAPADADTESKPLLVSRRELATILAALRCYQARNLQHERDITDTMIREIATDAGELDPLDSSEVDELCERLNAAPAAPSCPEP